MLRGYRLFIAALGLALASANHANAESGKQQPQTEQSATKSLSDIAAANRQEAERAKRADQDEAPCGEGKYGSSADLCAQWKAADAASDSAWWAWAAGIAGIVSTLGVVAALVIGQHSNSIARDTAKQQLRAYVGIDQYNVTPYELALPLTGRFLVGMKNFGQSPAIALATCVSYRVTEWVDQNTKPEVWDFESGVLPVDLPPGAHMFRDISFAEHAPAHSEELKSGASVLWVKFHACYEDIFGRRHEQTTYFHTRRASYLNKIMLVNDQTRETTA